MQNGEIYLEFSLFCNHRNPEVEEIIGFGRAVSKASRGSYGIIWVHDDESGSADRFQMYIISKGTFVMREDPFLSPA